MDTNTVTLKSRTGKTKSILVRKTALPGIEYLTISIRDYNNVQSVICNGDRPVILRVDGYKQWYQQVNGDFIAHKE